MAIRILQVSEKDEVNSLLSNLNVDPYGIRIMLPKAIHLTIKLDSIPSINAHILKQEMLSCGGDVALPRAVLLGKIKKTDCVVLGTLAQVTRLLEKLEIQPFGLKQLAAEIKHRVALYQNDPPSVSLPSRSLNLEKPRVMGIVNVTPDSFSGDGLSGASVDAIVEYGLQLVHEGADILDIGGESSRPGAKPVPLQAELARTIPVIKKLVKKTKIPVSIDTYKPAVAQEALDNGAQMVNDITGLRDPLMRKTVARARCGAVIMHMKGSPRTMQKNPVYECVIEDILGFLDRSISAALDDGIRPQSIIVDPGIGFGKTMEQNLEILKNLREFKVLGRPIMVGASRKSFIGKLLGTRPEERVNGSIAAAVLAIANGARIIRVHDVKATAQAIRVSEKILNLR